MIGTTFYFFDENRRHYERDKNGRSVGGAIFSKKFRPIVVYGETSRSWLAGPEWHPHKIPKKDFGKYYTHESMMEKIWAVSNRPKIKDAVGACSVSDLKRIADILGLNSLEKKDV